MKREINMRHAPDSSQEAIAQNRSNKNSFDCTQIFKCNDKINTDPYGSYTGVPNTNDIYEKPIQDVDDL